MRSKIVVAEQFRGPPNSGNGGYVCGLMASALGGPVTAMVGRARAMGYEVANLVYDKPGT